MFKGLLGLLLVLFFSSVVNAQCANGVCGLSRPAATRQATCDYAGCGLQRYSRQGASYESGMVVDWSPAAPIRRQVFRGRGPVRMFRGRLRRGCR